ncbi:MAG: outer membrane protein, partial [Conexibacter sp.]|nr:outer membrane protein [Conexibacter sp.]
MPVRLPLCVGMLLVLLLALAPAAAQAQAVRTWVSGTGNDANPCSRTAPCQTYAAAASATATDGEIDAIDSGGFGVLNIVKGLTLDGSGAQASILGSGAASAVIVNAPDAAVVLRDLSINGAGPAADACGAGSVNGIRILAARSVRIENVDISRFKGAAVLVAPSAGATSVSVEHVSIADMCTGRGIDVSPTGTGTAKVLVSNSNLSHLAVGVFAGTGGHAFLSGSTIFDAATGIATDGAGEIDDDGGNVFSGNGTDGTPTRKA